MIPVNLLIDYLKYLIVSNLLDYQMTLVNLLIDYLKYLSVSSLLDYQMTLVNLLNYQY